MLEVQHTRESSDKRVRPRYPSSRVRNVAMVGTYPPTECGLATFTQNVARAIAMDSADWRVSVVRVLDAPEVEVHDEVIAHWVGGDPVSMRRALAALSSAEVVVLQHEYGLFAGRDGAEVLDFVDLLSTPLVVVLHSVLAKPSRHQREILERLIRASSMVVVQSEHARSRLIKDYGARAQSVAVIAHGASANVDGERPEVEHPRILTWGLIGPGKGIEHAIAAVARLAGRDPAPTYVVAGATHPKVLAAEGERYRRGLEATCARLGVTREVLFDQGYRDWESLRALVRSADVVLLPYDSREQESSGVLVEALASGKPVVATRFPHAVELLSDGAGIIVEQGDVAAMSAALARVLYEPGVAEEMGRRALRASSSLLWPQVGLAYRALLSRVVSANRWG